MMTKEKSKHSVQETTITYDEVLAYDPHNKDKAIETLNIINATAKMIEQHCKDKSNALSYTQLRNILQAVKQNKDNLVVILPNLAYMEARQEKTKQKELIRFIRELLERCIEAKPDKTGTFLEYMDTIVAYHKYFSTK
jgi:CRISPR type III-A-associated protein Csm2